MARNGGPAFPRPTGNNGLTNVEEHEASGPQDGMTLRDYFATKALTVMAFKIDIKVTAHDGGCTVDDIGKALSEAYAKSAYQLADAMLAEREKEKTDG